MDFPALLLSFKLAATTSLILVPCSALLAWWICRSSSPLSRLASSICILPLVLPPTVLGFYLLSLLGHGGPLGDLNLVFSFGGLVVGSVIYSLPFALQPLITAFSAISQRQLEAAATLGGKPTRIFFQIVLPQSRLGLISAAVLSFAHTLGEFGVVLMIGGAIPGETRTASIAIFEQVEQLQYAQAHSTSLILIAVSFPVIYIVLKQQTWYNSRQ